MATTITTICCVLAVALSAWAAPVVEEAAQVPAQPTQVSAQLQIQPALPVAAAAAAAAAPETITGQDTSKQTPILVYAPNETPLSLHNIALEAANPGQEPVVVPVEAAEGGAALDTDLAASPDANPADGEQTVDLETANSFWRGYGGWGGYGGYGGWGGGYGGWGGYRPHYGGGWRNQGWGRGWGGGGHGGWGGYRGGYWG